MTRLTFLKSLTGFFVGLVVTAPKIRVEDIPNPAWVPCKQPSVHTNLITGKVTLSNEVGEYADFMEEVSKQAAEFATNDYLALCERQSFSSLSLYDTSIPDWWWKRVKREPYPRPQK